MLNKLLLSAVAPFCLLSTVFTCSFAEENTLMTFKDVKTIMIHDMTCKGMIKTSDNPETSVNVVASNKEQLSMLDIKEDSNTLHIKQSKKDTCEARLEINVPKDKEIEYNTTFINSMWSIDNISQSSKLTLRGDNASLEVNYIKADKLETLMDGNNNTLNVKDGNIKTLESKIQGPSKAIYNVNAESSKAEIIGNGSIDIKNVTKKASNEVKGNGEIKITSGKVESMESKIYGNGKIKYGGSTEKAKNIIVGNGTIDIQTAKSNEDEIKGNGKVIINKSK